MIFLHYICYQLVNIVDLADGRDCIRTVMGAHDQRLGFKIRDATDAQIALHVMDVVIELGTEGRILNIMNGPVKTVFPIHRQTGPAGSQVGMVVRAEKQIKYAILF